RRSVAGVGLWFAGNGAVLASILPWYPLLVYRLGLNSWQFGLAVACYAAGSLLSSGLPAALIARFGAHRVVIGGTVLLGLAAATTAWSVNGLMMAICLLLLGCCDAIVDVAQNVVGIAAQERLQRTILSSMHALWSLGCLLSGLAGTVAASSGVDMRVWLAAVAIIAVAVTIVGRRFSGDGAAPRRVADSDAAADTEPASPDASPGPGPPRAKASICVCGWRLLRSSPWQSRSSVADSSATVPHREGWPTRTPQGTRSRPRLTPSRARGRRVRRRRSCSPHCRWRSSPSAVPPSRTSRTIGRVWPQSGWQAFRPPRRGSPSASSSAANVWADSAGTCW